MNIKQIIFVIITVAVLVWIVIKNKDSLTKQSDMSVQENMQIVYYFDSTTNTGLTASYGDSIVTVMVPAKGTVTLEQKESASGSKYENGDQSIIFWEKDGEVILIENGEQTFVGEKEVFTDDPSDMMVPEGDEAPEITQHVWVWTSTQMSDGAVVSPKKANVFTLTFTADGRVSGTTDCNSFGGTYDISNGEIMFSPLASTKMYCDGSQEQQFTDMITKTNSLMFTESGDLVLLLSYDSGSILFKKQ